MSTTELGAERVLLELERVLRSPGFVRNQRRSHFLRYLVERHLEGRDNELKESVIGIEIFGRQPGYNPKADAIVRAEARRLRTLLNDYYSGGGKGDEVVIELPKGRYVPAIRYTAAEPASRVGSRWPVRLSVVLLAPLVVAGLASLWIIQRNVSVGSANKTPRLGQNHRKYEASPAYDLYLHARAAYHAGQEIPDPDVDIYEQAIAKDPTFAPGYAGLGAAYAFASSRPIGARKDRLPKMRAAAERALELDPLLPQAHDAMGVVYAHLGEWEKSERSFSRAIQLDPEGPTLRLDFAMNLLLPVGWISNALQQVHIAETTDPGSPDVQDAYAYILISAGDFNQAEEHCRKSRDPGECIGRIRIGQGRFDEAIELLQAVANTRYLGFAYGRAGRREEAEKLAAISAGRLQQILIYAGLGDKNRTIEVLDRMSELGPVRIGRTLTFPELSLVRGDPRVRALRKKVGLPE